MVRTAPLYDNPLGDGHIVRAPRRTDALGQSLKRAYNTQSYLPPEIAASLAKLSRVPR